MTGKFEIDDKGFRTQMSEVPLWRLVQEIISNSFDEKAVQTVKCDITQVQVGDDSEFDYLRVKITDDGKGFRDLKDIYTLYADSYKRTNTKQSGRFNEGEKRFIAVAESAYVQTKGWEFTFDKNGKTKRQMGTSAPQGTTVLGLFKTEESRNQVISELNNLAVPHKKKLFINGKELPPKVLVKKFETRLMTVKAEGKNQKLIRVKEECDVYIYEKNSGEEPIIYELGIPVQKLDEKFKWHVDIRQKIPQSTSRDVISTNYLQVLYSEVITHTLDLITEDDAGTNWASQALKRTDSETSKEILKKKYGKEIIIKSTTDYRSNERAEMAGLKVISGSELDPEVRDNLISNDVLKYAGQEFATNAFEFAKPVKPTVEMEIFARVCDEVALDAIHRHINVSFVTTKETNEIAQYGKGNLLWNVRLCGGKKFFNTFSERAIGILIHELSHDKLGNNEGNAHISHDYIHEMERIAGLVGSKGIQHWIDKIKVIQN